jgi:WD40 repeat protein
MRKNIQEWLRFIRAESHVLTKPFFQQAANQPDSTAPDSGCGLANESRHRRNSSAPLTEQATEPFGFRIDACGHTDEARCVAVASNARRAVSGSRDSAVRIWDLDTGAELSPSRTRSTVSIHRHGAPSSLRDANSVAICSRLRTPRLRLFGR